MSNLFVPIEKAKLDWKDSVPFSSEYDDVYFSCEGGIEQTHYVFIEGNNLISRWRSLSNDNPKKFTIGEIGFGTGLNFLVSWNLWEQNAPLSCKLHFISCEKHPLSLNDLKKCLSSWPQLEKQAQQLIEIYPILTPGYHYFSFCDGRVELTLMLGDAYECYEQILICGDSKLEGELRPTYIDSWFLDGFNPKNNKAMWSSSLIKIIAMLSNNNTTLATYSAAGCVKKVLEQHGFIIEKRKGFGSKRHMISAYFKISQAHAAKKRSTPWHASKTENYFNKSAVVIGAGLAGCFTAYSLANRGWKVTILEELNNVACGGSGNQQAILLPKLSAYNSSLTEFMLSAFLYANRVYRKILQRTPIGALEGSLILAHNKREHASQLNLRQWLSVYPEIGVLLDAKQASEIAGISLSQAGLFIPLSGWINSTALCQFLINTKGISLITNTEVKNIFFDKLWKVNDIEAPVLILANSHKVNSFKETEYLPITPIRGQITSVTASPESKKLKVPVCAEGYLLPALNGLHLLGASFDMNNKIPQIKCEDDQINLSKIKQFAPQILESSSIKNHWAGIRASTPDYLPLVGKIADRDKFFEVFSKLKLDAKLWIPKAGPYYPGLYVCAGFGSRGLTTIPLCAEWLASLINNDINILPRRLEQALSPVRYLRKQIVQEPLHF